MARSLRDKQWSEEDIELIYLNRRLRDCKSISSGGNNNNNNNNNNILCEGCIAQILGLWCSYQHDRLPTSEAATMLTPEQLAELRHTHAAEMADVERETLEAMGGQDPPSLDSHFLRLWIGILLGHDDDRDLLRAKLMFAMRGNKYGLYDLVHGPALRDWLEAMEKLQKRRAQEESNDMWRRSKNGGSSNSTSSSSSTVHTRKAWSSCRCRYQEMGSKTARGFWLFIKPRLHGSISNAIESHYFANNNAHPVCAADIYITMSYLPLQADLGRIAGAHRAELAGRLKLAREMQLVEEAFRGLGQAGSGLLGEPSSSCGNSSGETATCGQIFVSIEHAEREAVRTAYEIESGSLGPLGRAYTARQAARDAFAKSHGRE